MIRVWHVVIVAALLWSAHRAVAAPHIAVDWPEAVQLARQSGSVRIVLLTGSDWDPVSKAATSLLTAPAFLAAVDDCVLLRIDHPDHPNDEQKALLEKNKDFKPSSYHYPALIAMDANEQLIGTADGVNGDAQRWAGVIGRWLEPASRRDALLARAENQTGLARARLLGAALDALDFDIACGNGKWIDALKKADEKDATGYVFKYTFNPYSIGEHGVANAGNNADKIRETLKETERHLANRVITTEQKQQLHALRYGCFLRLPGQRPAARIELEAAIALDPKSDTGQGAARLLTLLTREIQFDRAKKSLEADPSDRAAAAALLEVADAADLETLPPFEPPPGKLIQGPMELAFSSVSSQWGEPWKHVLLTQAVYRGNFHTDSEVRPWITVKLPRVESISGIVVFSSGPKDRLVPLKIEVSLDGQKWEQVARHEKPFDRVVVDLSSEARKGQWVRVSRDDGRKEFFHLSNLLVYRE
jgi:hypothetical protein